jgi:hypothetical protein
VIQHTYSEISGQQRNDRFFDAWYYNAARQRTIVTHLVDEVSKLVRVAQKYYEDDPELEKALFDAQGACLGLRLSFLVSTPELKGWAAEEGIQAAEEIQRALMAKDQQDSGDGGDQA